jgi:hypothetical protein
MAKIEGPHRACVEWPPAHGTACGDTTTVRTERPPHPSPGGRCCFCQGRVVNSTGAHTAIAKTVSPTFTNLTAEYT